MNQNYTLKLGTADKSLMACFPDFMVISPAKTGSTWLFENLRCHPQVFIPEVKEINYFCTRYKLYSINWYLKYFKKGIGLKKGDVSPIYAILPLYSIKAIRSFMPKLKLIFLMRDPIERAWSHAKHNLKYQEANFRFRKFDINDVPDEKIIENFTNVWPFAFGDYLGSLKRWLSFYPKNQIFIEFYESIFTKPKELLIQIFDFLEIESKIDWTQFPTSHVFFSGLKKNLALEHKQYLKSIYKKKTEELSGFLKEQFSIEIPSEWKNTLEGGEISTPIRLKEEYKDYSIFMHMGRFYAIPKKNGVSINAEQLKVISKEMDCFAGNSLFEVTLFIYHLRYLSDKKSSNKNTDTFTKNHHRKCLFEISKLEIDDYCLNSTISTLPIGYSENYILFQFDELFYAFPREFEDTGDIAQANTRDHPDIISALEIGELEELTNETFLLYI